MVSLFFLLVVAVALAAFAFGRSRGRGFRDGGASGVHSATTTSIGRTQSVARNRPW
jgi:hypothetical protein